MTKLRRIEHRDRIFFITTNLIPSVPSLSPSERDLVLHWLGEIRIAHRFLLLGYVIMLEHAHVLLASMAESLPNTIHQ
jgi:hypothetical protein